MRACAHFLCLCRFRALDPSRKFCTFCKRKLLFDLLERRQFDNRRSRRVRRWAARRDRDRKRALIECAWSAVIEDDRRRIRRRRRLETTRLQTATRSLALTEARRQRAHIWRLLLVGGRCGENDVFRRRRGDVAFSPRCDRCAADVRRHIERSVGKRRPFGRFDCRADDGRCADASRVESCTYAAFEIRRPIGARREACEERRECCAALGDSRQT